MATNVSFTRAGNALSTRWEKLDHLGQTTDASLFEVTNELTGVVTHAPGGVIGRFLNGDYTVKYVGENRLNPIGLPEGILPPAPAPSPDTSAALDTLFTGEETNDADE